MGIIGQRIPKPDAEKCRGCKKCQIEKSCPVHVPKLVDGKLYIDPEECTHCGRCKGKCPFGAVPEYQNGYKIYIGGRWGKRISHGQALTRIFTEEEEVMGVIEKAILLFKDEGIKKALRNEVTFPKCLFSDFYFYVRISTAILLRLCSLFFIIFFKKLLHSLDCYQHTKNQQ